MGFEQELSVARKAARRAGEIMMRYQQDGFTTERKGDDGFVDLVTEADFRCQEAIIDTIRETFPDDGFLAEENAITPEAEERVWVVDPIDGTSNFVHGFPYFCCSIALQVDGEERVAVVYNPNREELFHAVSGEGAFMNGERITVSDTGNIEGATVIAILATWLDDAREPGLRFLRSLTTNAGKARKYGAVALDLCQVASGRADAVAEVAIGGIWDVAAGSLIVEEAGGAVRRRESIVEGVPETVASNGKIQQLLEELLDDAVRD